MINKTPDNLFKWGKQPVLKILKYAGLGIGAALLIAIVAFILFSDHFVNTLLKDRVTKAFKKAYPTDSIKLGDMHYNILTNRLGCDSITIKTTEYKCSVVSFSVKGVNWIKIFLRNEFTTNTLNGSVIDAHRRNADERRSRRAPSGNGRNHVLLIGSQARPEEEQKDCKPQIHERHTSSVREGSCSQLPHGSLPGLWQQF